jgi:plasmid stabilization system protein ParE
MSLAVNVSGRAETDLTHQYRWYLGNANAEVAERFLKAFEVTAEKLAQQPGLGWARKFRAPELSSIRSYPVGSRFEVHLIFYREYGDALSIERMMHGARDLPRRLLEPPED